MKKVITMKMLIINPGSTSTKVSYFEDEKNVYTESIFHDAPELLKYPPLEHHRKNGGFSLMG